MAQPPPPPPPHGENPKTTGGSGLPPGKYDIFIIPEHSAGGGFLYLPSLRPNINSFVAGFACALILVVLGQSMAPAFQAWWSSFQGMGNMGVVLLLVAVGLGAWSLGRQQLDGPPGGDGGSGGFGGTTGASTSSAPPPNAGPPPNSPPNPETPRGNKTGPTWGTPRPPPSGTTRADDTSNTTPKGAWEKAREETRRREEERKAKEAEQKRKEEVARRLKELREKEAREREQREKEAQEREAKERERKEREAKEKEEQRRKEEEEKNARKGSTYAYSGVGERINPWPNGKPVAPAASASASAAASSQPASPSPARAAPSPPPSTPTKKPPAPTAKTYLGTEEEAYSFRPYDKPKRPAHRKSFSDLSEASWAPSQSTARTTPPPSVRAPYSTKDPDKIVIKAVYGFVNQFAKTPASQLVSGVGTVTDGLILRITTEGLFIDDDVRGVAQREWDVKAWTLKLVEVWCPQHSANLLANSSNPPGGANNNNHHPFFKAMGSTRLRASERGAPKTLTGDEADAYLTDMLRACKDSCRLGLCPDPCAPSASASASSVSSNNSSRGSNAASKRDKTGEWKAKGLHLLRATVRDQEGKRYLFVISDEESWKVSVGLQRLRRGTQVRALGVAGMSGLETRSTLEMLGWGV